ncbi:MAG: ATP synthase F1 subunit gamma [Bryobacteraceae bacterium]
MPSLLDLRRRIRTVKGTQQITKAMKMVAAARLRRAQDRVIAARPYAQILREMLANVAAAAMEDERTKDHPLLVRRPERRVTLLLLTADRGLAGAFNANLIRAGQRFLEERASSAVEIEAMGRKGRDFFRRRRTAISGEYIGLYQKALFDDAAAVASKAMTRYQAGEIDAVYLLYNEFKSVVAQKLAVERVLPVEIPSGATPPDYIYEQPIEQLLNSLLPHYVQVSVYHAVLESAAAEHAARMTAMDAATSNAAEVIDKLTLYMNRVRQASITKELIEVVSGAAALE